MSTLILTATILTATITGPIPAPRADTLTLTRNTRVAGAYWHATPPCGPITITIDPGLRERTATMAQAWPDSCAITIMPTSDPLLSCALITHEVGHLLGHPHTTDPETVMWPGPKMWPNRNCLRHWDTEWRCHRARCFWARVWQPFRR